MNNFNFEMPDFGMPDFDVSGFDDESGKITRAENRYCLPSARRDVKSYMVKYDRAEDFAKQVGPAILAGDKVCALLSGNFIFGDFFEAFAVSQNVLIDSLQISTLSFSQENVDSLKNLFDGDYLRKLDIIVSDYFWSHNRQNAPYIYKQLDHGDRFQLAVAGTHTKIALMNIQGKKIVVSGSANLRSSRCIEEITIQTCTETYDFHHAWQSVILDRYATIKKTVRSSALYDMIIKGVEEKEKWGAK